MNGRNECPHQIREDLELDQLLESAVDFMTRMNLAEVSTMYSDLRITITCKEEVSND